MPSARPRIGSCPRSRTANGGAELNRAIAARDARKPPSTLAAEFFQPRRGIHDVAVENDGALDVADFADDHRPEMQAAANPRARAELAFELARGA